MQVSVNSPKTFYIRFTKEMPRVFKLYENDGKLYYFRYLDGKTPRIKFNIPDNGIYKSDTPFEVVDTKMIETPINFPELPKAERDRLKKTNIVYNPQLTGTPARIFTHSGKIEVSKDFYTLPKPIRLFLLLHEQGHFFYKTEDYCDTYALVNFLRMGYNSSAAYYALSKVLKRTPQNVDRTKKLFNEIQKTR